MEIRTKSVSVTTVGGAGVAAGSVVTDELYGFLLDIALDYHASCPATADVTISEATFGNIIVKTDNKTDIRLTPRLQTQDIAAANSGNYDRIPLSGKLTISVAQADALTDCLVATIRWMSL